MVCEEMFTMLNTPRTVSMSSHAMCLKQNHDTRANLPANHILYRKMAKSFSGQVCLSFTKKMVNFDEETSNTLFETLEDWNTYLKKENIDINKLHQEPKP